MWGSEFPLPLWGRAGWGPLRLLLQIQRQGVDAVALPGRLRPVVEDVAEVRPAVLAEDFRPAHEETVVGVKLDRLQVGRLVKARPPGTRFELGLRTEQLGAAGGATIGAVGLGMDVFARERPLRSLAA